MAAIALVTIAITGCAATRHPTSPPSATARPSVVAIGDSIMKGHGLGPDQAWPALMAVRHGWRLDNLACDGAGFLTTGDDSDCAETFAGLVTKAVEAHPQTVIVEGSSNDFGEDDDALLGETVTELKRLRAALPHAQIIGLSTIWGDTAAPAQLADVDNQVRLAVRDAGGIYLDVGQPLSGHPEWMQPDDVHPTAAGQLAIFAAVDAAFVTAGIRI